MTHGDTEEVKKKHRQRGKNKRIGFSEETVTKEEAKSLLVQESHEKPSADIITKVPSQNIQDANRSKGKRKEKRKKLTSKPGDEHSIELPTKKKRKRNEHSEAEDTLGEEQPKVEGQTKTPSKKKSIRNNMIEAEDTSAKVNNNEESKEQDILKTKETDVNKPLSKRALKKMKYQKVLEDKKTMVTMAMQQKSLTYLSNWKHNRQNWKFEKLKQIWLLQNLYDATRIDNKFWDVTVEYFSSSMGKVHKKILDEAIKIAESESDSSEESVKLKRARDLIQNLQE